MRIGIVVDSACDLPQDFIAEHNIVLLPILTFYFLRDWDILVERAVSLIPRNHVATVSRLARESDEVLGAFIRGQIVVMVALWAMIAGLARVGGAVGRLARPRWVNAFFGKAQIASAAYMGFAHGHNDAQKTMGIIAMTLIGAEATGALDDLPSWLAFMHPDAHAGDGIAMWIVLTCAVVMAAGTASGGWKIIKTLGHKMVKLHPIHGFAAETSSATILTLAAHFGMPVSTTHSISTAIMGVGFAKNPRSLRFGVIERIVWAWILTIPAAAGCAYLILQLFSLAGWH